MKIHSLLFILILLLIDGMLYSKITINNKLSGNVELRFKSCNKSYYKKGTMKAINLEDGSNEIDLFKDENCDFSINQKIFVRVMSGKSTASISNSVDLEDGVQYEALVEDNRLKFKKL